jgi:PAT family beta-lactamase induction signal transducer AmpG
MAGQVIEAMGFVSFYVLTALAALPGILIFWYMMRSGLVDRALGDAGRSRAGAGTKT